MGNPLLEKAQKGDADAFAELVAPYEGLVYRHCLQTLRNEADAQEAAQEAMLRAYRAIGRFRGGSSVATWLYRIAHNVCLDMRKRPQAHREVASLQAMADEGFDPPSATPDPEQAYLKGSEQARLREAMTRLPVEWQTLLSLRYGDGLSYEQLAKALRMGLGTVKSRLNRAKEKLRALLDEN